MGRDICDERYCDHRHDCGLRNAFIDANRDNNKVLDECDEFNYTSNNEFQLDFDYEFEE